MLDHAAFVARAEAIFPGSTISGQDTYVEARQRLLQCIREGAPTLPQVDRWALACEAAALSRNAQPEPYTTWAQRMIDTDLADMVSKFLAAGVDPGEESADPLRWVARVPVCSEVRALIHEVGWRPSFDGEFAALPVAYAEALAHAVDYGDTPCLSLTDAGFIAGDSALPFPVLTDGFATGAETAWTGPMSDDDYLKALGRAVDCCREELSQPIAPSDYLEDPDDYDPTEYQDPF